MEEIKFTKQTVEAKSRQLSAEYTIEEMQPLISVTSALPWYARLLAKLPYAWAYKLRKRLGWITAEEELAEILAEEIRKEIDKEIIAELKQKGFL